MKYLLIIGLLAYQINAYSQTATPQINKNKKEAAANVKEVTVPQFLKHLTAMQKNANGNILQVMLLPQAGDVIEVQYNGAENKDLSKLIEQLTHGDKVFVQAQDKQTTVASQTFLIKK